MKIVTENNIDALQTTIEKQNKPELLGQKLVTTSAIHTLSYVIKNKQNYADMRKNIKYLRQQLEIIEKQLLKFN